nr:immunoglobulin light chain junction region [Macaca mulatta]MOV84264.1 immunoglobulin light chain junction region [Macaca mulatta]
CQQGQTYPLTF